MAQILFVNLSLSTDDSYTVGPLTVLTSLKSKGLDGDFYDNVIHGGHVLERGMFYEDALNRNLPIIQTPESTQRIFTDIEKLITPETKMIGFCVLFPNIEAVIYFAKVIKEKQPHILIALGGPYFFYPEKFAHTNMDEMPFIDCYIRGRAEEAMAQIVEHKFQLKDLKHVPGLCFKEDHGWHLSQVTNQFDNFTPISYYRNKDSKVVHVSLSIGCPFKCTFCTQDLFYKDYIRAPIEKCMEILTPLRGQKVFITDALLNASHVWLRKLCEAMIKNKLDLQWASWFRVAGELRDPEYINLLYESGCRRIDFGLESASGDVLRHMMKFHNEQGIYEVFNNIRQMNHAGKRLQLTVNILVGYPTETEKDFMKTYNFILFNRDIITQVSSCNIVSVSPESRLFKGLNDKKQINYVDPDNWATEFNNPEIRFDRLKRMKDLLQKLNLMPSHSHDAYKLELEPESWATFSSPASQGA